MGILSALNRRLTDLDLPGVLTQVDPSIHVEHAQAWRWEPGDAEPTMVGLDQDATEWTPRQLVVIWHALGVLSEDPRAFDAPGPGVLTVLAEYLAGVEREAGSRGWPGGAGNTVPPVT